MTRLYVGNISEKSDLNDLKEVLSECGKIKNFDIRDGSGYIEYETLEEAEEAVKKYNGYEYNGKNLLIEAARRIYPRSNRGGRRFPQRERRRYSRSNSRSRSRNRRRRNHDRSRSRSRSSFRSRSRSRDRNHKKRSRRSRSRS